MKRPIFFTHWLIRSFQKEDQISAVIAAFVCLCFAYIALIQSVNAWFNYPSIRSTFTFTFLHVLPINRHRLFIICPLRAATTANYTYQCSHFYFYVDDYELLIDQYLSPKVKMVRKLFGFFIKIFAGKDSTDQFSFFLILILMIIEIKTFKLVNYNFFGCIKFSFPWNYIYKI